MNISIATVFPDLYRDFLNTSLIKRLQEKEIASYDVVSFSSFCNPKERIDAPAVGHGAGMVIRPEVVERLVDAQDKKWGKSYKIFLTPQGKKLDQTLSEQLAKIFQEQKHVMLLAGRYEGIDQRAHEEYADLEVSIGDYVLMGGDLAAMVLLEAVMRYVPGVVGKDDSVAMDSFSGTFVDFPTYATPAKDWRGHSVPEILTSGNHAALKNHRNDKAAQRSVRGHFGWVKNHCRTKEDKSLVSKHMPHHYLVLMHDNVLVQDGKIGTSSVTTLDIHDIARSCCTYGVKNYFLVTPLVDQHKIVETMLNFWHGAGIDYNRGRAQAVDLVQLSQSLDQVIADIEKKEGKKPLLVATSAKQQGDASQRITFFDQDKVWVHDRPVLLIFGTAKGLSDELINRCDFLLLPIDGFTEFNHLSVRSAAAIILDRWMGINLTEVD